MSKQMEIIYPYESDKAGGWCEENYFYLKIIEIEADSALLS